MIQYAQEKEKLEIEGILQPKKKADDDDSYDFTDIDNNLRKVEERMKQS